MPERNVCTESLRAGAALRAGQVTLLPVERCVVRAASRASGVWLIADKRPHALVVRDASGTWAIDAEGGPIPVEALRAEVPGLDAALAAT